MFEMINEKVSMMKFFKAQRFEKQQKSALISKQT